MFMATEKGNNCNGGGGLGVHQWWQIQVVELVLVSFLVYLRWIKKNI